MWPTIDRARRRLGGGAPDPADGAGDAVTPSSGRGPATDAATDAVGVDTMAPCRTEDIVIVLGGLELDQLRTALKHALGDAVEHPNTPARLERALSLLLASRGVPGRPTVLRRPAGLSTPESWEIHLDGVERATGTAVRDAGRTGRFAW